MRAAAVHRCHIFFLVLVLFYTHAKPVKGDWFEEMLACLQNTTPCCGQQCICTETCFRYGSVCRCRSKDDVVAMTPPNGLEETPPDGFDMTPTDVFEDFWFVTKSYWRADVIDYFKWRHLNLNQMRGKTNGISETRLYFFKFIPVL